MVLEIVGINAIQVHKFDSSDIKHLVPALQLYYHWYDILINANLSKHLTG